MIVLGDDGTMDTVVRCTECGAELRYNFDPAAAESDAAEDDGKDPYDEFVTWAIDDATNEHACPRYALVKTHRGDYLVQETDTNGNLVALYDADGETVVDGGGSSRIGNLTWELIRDIGLVTGDTDDFHAAVATCPELKPTEES